MPAGTIKAEAEEVQPVQKECDFLGHIIDQDGVRTDPDKITKVNQWRVPTTVRAFVGLTSYYRRFIKDYAMIAKPLHELTKKDNVFKWTEDCQIAFEFLKAQLVGSDILALPDPANKDYLLDTDASGLAIGAVLSQIQGSRERVLAYGSRCLDKVE